MAKKDGFYSFNPKGDKQPMDWKKIKEENK